MAVKAALTELKVNSVFPLAAAEGLPLRELPQLSSLTGKLNGVREGARKSLTLAKEIGC